MSRLLVLAFVLAGPVAADSITLRPAAAARLGGPGPYRGVVRARDPRGLDWQVHEPGWSRTRPLVRIAWSEVARIEDEADTIDDVRRIKRSIERFLADGTGVKRWPGTDLRECVPATFVLELSRSLTRFAIDGSEPDPGFSRAARDFIAGLFVPEGVESVAVWRRHVALEAGKGIELVLRYAADSAREGRSTIALHQAHEALEFAWAARYQKDLPESLLVLAALRPPARGNPAALERLAAIRSGAWTALAEQARTEAHVQVALVALSEEPAAAGPREVALAAAALAGAPAGTVRRIVAGRLKLVEHSMRKREPVPEQEAILVALLAESPVAREQVEFELARIDADTTPRERATDPYYQRLVVLLMEARRGS